MLFELTQVFSVFFQAKFATFQKTSAEALERITDYAAAHLSFQLKNHTHKESHVGADVPTAQI
jgi:hypothetical protein